MADDALPVIDIAPYLKGRAVGKARVAEQVLAACEEIGFLTVVGHGVPEDLIAQTRRTALEFFNLPAGEKRRYVRSRETLSRGYSVIGDQALSYSLGRASPPDYQESFVIGPFDLPADPYYTCETGRRFFSPNVWPEHPAAIRSLLQAYFRAMEDLASKIMRIFATALDLDEGFFADKTSRAISSLKLVHYPAQERPPLEGQLRAGAHTDYGTLTILLAEDKPGGLQVRSRAGKWVDVHPQPGSFVINIGDMMMRWTNDQWVSTLHRVANPPCQHASVPRLSVVFFQQPNYDTEIRCLDRYVSAAMPARYAPITAGEHWQSKQAKARGKTA